MQISVEVPFFQVGSNETAGPGRGQEPPIINDHPIAELVQIQWLEISNFASQSFLITLQASSLTKRQAQPTYKSSEWHESENDSPD